MLPRRRAGQPDTSSVRPPQGGESSPTAAFERATACHDRGDREGPCSSVIETLTGARCRAAWPTRGSSGHVALAAFSTLIAPIFSRFFGLTGFTIERMFGSIRCMDSGVERLHEVIDALAAVDLRYGSVGEELLALERARARLDAEVARRLRFDRSCEWAAHGPDPQRISRHQHALLRRRLPPRRWPVRSKRSSKPRAWAAGDDDAPCGDDRAGAAHVPMTRSTPSNPHCWGWRVPGRRKTCRTRFGSGATPSTPPSTAMAPTARASPTGNGSGVRSTTRSRSTGSVSGESRSSPKAPTSSNGRCNAPTNNSAAPTIPAPPPNCAPTRWSRSPAPTSRASPPARTSRTCSSSPTPRRCAATRSGNAASPTAPASRPTPLAASRATRYSRSSLSTTPACRSGSAGQLARSRPTSSGRWSQETVAVDVAGRRPNTATPTTSTNGTTKDRPTSTTACSSAATAAIAECTKATGKSSGTPTAASSSLIATATTSQPANRDRASNPSSPDKAAGAPTSNTLTRTRTDALRHAA